jgi:hypothetical protein
MAIEVADSVRQFLAEADAAGMPLRDFLSPPVPSTPEGSELTEAQRKGGRAEVWPWQFDRPNMFERRSPWGIYWAETFSGDRRDGTRWNIPDADEVDAEIIDYWIVRAREVRHPVLRSRYSDLAWEIGNYLRRRGLPGIRPPIEVVGIAIDAYLEAVERRLFEDNSDAWQYINRAIELSKSINDAERQALSRDALFAFRESVRNVSAHEGQTWRYYDIAEEHFGRNLHAALKAQGIADLQAELRITSNVSNPETFNPHSASDTAERIQRWGLLAGQQEVGREAVLAAGAAFEQAAANAGGLVATAWLEELLPRYREIGDTAGAARVEEAVRRRSEDAEAEMTTHSVTVEIPRKEFDEFAEEICGDTLDEALARIAGAVLLKYNPTVEQVRETLEGALLYALINISVTGPEGFTEATVGGIDDDEEGRAIHHAGQKIGWHSGMLAMLFERMCEKYSPTAAQLADYIEGTTLFRKERRQLLERGLQAWLDGDSVVAAHLLVPQVEAALRVLCTASGGSVMSPNDVGGFNVDGMGKVLHKAAMRASMPADVRFHLKSLFTDPRGLNVRNHLAHGMSLPGTLDTYRCNWILHAVLLLALFQPRSEAGPPKSTVQSRE